MLEDGLTFADGATLTIAGSRDNAATVRIDGAQTIGGTGTILMSAENALGDRIVNNDFTFDGRFASREILTIDSGVTLRGDGELSTVEAEDAFRLLGTVAGEGRGLVLREIDNAGASFTIDASLGDVILANRIADAVLLGATAADAATLATNASVTRTGPSKLTSSSLRHAS